MSDLIFRMYQHLLPDGEATDTVPDKQLREYYEGMSNSWDDVKEFYDDIWLDLYPQTTRELEAWEDQFNLTGANAITEQQRRDRLAGAWSAQGGQDPKYIQDTIQAAGFNVYIHEFWELPKVYPPVVRNPNLYINDSLLPVYTMEAGEPLAQAGETNAEAGDSLGGLGYLLVNKIRTSTKNLVMLAGEDIAEAGEPLAEAGQFDTFIFGFVQYEIPGDPDTWPYFLYFGAETFPDTAIVPAARRNEFETLVRRITPAQQWLGMLIQYN